ncbi:MULTISPECIES: hypothetical protein [Vibrio]|uniref:hypothetical protein n=1 Tax=Vibrio TaxID=662 RepID=UPI0014839B95|nr:MULTISPECIES: hypothetical protein [Vibrio]MBF4425260.1 hypothetical protein [Vibrio anguillarum]MDQ2190601.1 hypothetical protein [Vibrio sp. A14(2019)]MDQ2196809.1 hypothetical protein [Vibrio sp. 2017_1457_11]NNN75348.1 hypothetical protein [Vibrio sp. B7]NNN92077.1 hypothetical protein [Vibrio sp. B8-1]
MKQLTTATLTKALEGFKAIQLHKTSFEQFLANTPKSDPFYDDLKQLIQLSDQCEKLEINVGDESLKIINQFNALSDQLSNKLNAIS